MIINFRAREISRGRRKLARTPILIKKKLLIIGHYLYIMSHRINYNYELFQSCSTKFGAKNYYSNQERNRASQKLF
jgi:hypothetical protein